MDRRGLGNPHALRRRSGKVGRGFWLCNQPDARQPSTSATCSGVMTWRRSEPSATRHHEFAERTLLAHVCRLKEKVRVVAIDGAPDEVVDRQQAALCGRAEPHPRLVGIVENRISAIPVGKDIVLTRDAKLHGVVDDDGRLPVAAAENRQHEGFH